MSKKMTINRVDIYSILVFFSCVEIPFLTRSHGQNYLFLARVIILTMLVFGFLVSNKAKRKSFYKSIICLISIWFLYLIGVTCMTGKDVLYAFRLISIPFLMAFYLFRYEKKTIRILHCWQILLALLVVVDFITMIIFPNGMYNDGLYDLNWFLGYKTARFQIELPLCVISAYLSKIENGKISIISYLYIGLSMFCTWKAESTSAFVCIGLFLVLLLFLDLGGKIKNGRKFLCKLFDYKIILVFYIVAVICLISINSIPFVQKFVEDFLHKDATLTTRTYIWQIMLRKIAQRPIWGYGVLDQTTYISMTNSLYANSAHSMAIGLLIEGGIIGTLLYMAILRKALYKRKNDFNDQNLILIAGIIVLLIVGLTSVTMLYCEFSMVLYVLLYTSSNFLNGGLYEHKKI